MNYYVKRILQSVLTAYLVVTATFFIIRLIPGGPLDYLRAQFARRGMSPAQIDELVEAYAVVRPDAPLYVQYINFLGDVLRGNLGKSMQYNEPVTGIIVDSLPWTLFVIVVALFISYVVAILLGAFMAYYQGSRFDSVGSVLSIFFNSIPYYVVAVIALWFLSYQQGIFPTGGRVNDTYQAAFSVKYVGSILRHATLPILSFALTTFGIRALAMRGNSIRVLGEGYLRVARLRGLPERRIGVMYVARNAILPMYTEIMISIGFLLGGSIILEQLFRYPGIGYYMFQAIQTRDYPLMMGCFMVIILMVITGVLIADLTYGKLDPRASGGGQRESF